MTDPSARGASAEAVSSTGGVPAPGVSSTGGVASAGGVPAPGVSSTGGVASAGGVPAPGVSSTGGVSSTRGVSSTGGVASGGGAPRPDGAPEPAATVVPLRDGPSGLQVLMLRRNATGTFAGMWVFPGGRVDPEDAADGADELEAARRAAAREAVEEAGVIVDPVDLVPFSHWTPPEGPGRRFPTWFFLAAIGETADVTVDGGEIHEHAWISPADALRRRDEGQITLAPPTWMTLHHLSGSHDVHSVLSRARSEVPTRFATRIARDGDVLVATWEGDAAYVDGDLAAPGGRHRLTMDPAGWKVDLRR